MHDSTALTVEGLPAELSPNQSYELSVTFENPDGNAAGFQLIAWSDNSDAGIIKYESDNMEAVGSAIRSTLPVVEKGLVSWSIRWHTPANITKSMTIFVAATAANDDQSPLGDRVHFISYAFSGGTRIQRD